MYRFLLVLDRQLQTGQTELRRPDVDVLVMGIVALQIWGYKPTHQTPVTLLRIAITSSVLRHCPIKSHANCLHCSDSSGMARHFRDPNFFHTQVCILELGLFVCKRLKFPAELESHQDWVAAKNEPVFSAENDYAAKRKQYNLVRLIHAGLANAL